MEQAVSAGKRVGKDLTQGPIMRTLLTFAIPIILTNLIQQLYSMVDVIVIGQFVGNIGTVGVNTGGEVADLVTPIATSLASAGQIYIAQLTGSGDRKRANETIGTLLSLMIGISVVLAAVTIGLSGQILSWLHCPEEAVGQAQAYMIITALGYPFIFGYNAVVGILRGMGESKRPLIFVLVAAIVNVVLDILLVAVIPMEAAGTAIATAASQLGSFAAAAVFLWKECEQFDFKLEPASFRINPKAAVVIIELGSPQVARSILVRSGMLWVNANANSYGMIVSATNSVGNKLQKFLEVYIQGVDTASAAMVGQNLGAKKTERAGKVTMNTLLATMVCAAGISVLCLLFPHQIFGLFTRDEAVIQMGAVFLKIMIVHYFASAFVGSFQAMVTGCGFVSLGFAIGVLDGLVCKVGLSWLFVNVFHMGYLGLFWGVATSRILPELLCAAYFFSGKWKTRKLLNER